MILHAKLQYLLKRHFDLLTIIDCRHFINDPSLLSKQLAQFQNRQFDPKQKILLIHMETDYYDPLLPFGLIPINVTRIFKNLDIPLHALVFVTMHHGIRREFDLLLKNHPSNDRPIIIETILNKAIMPESYTIDNELSFDQIEKHAICMMNVSRSHRVAMWNFLVKNNLLEKIAVSQHFNV